MGFNLLTGLLGLGTSLLGGKESSVSYTDPENLISPESGYETNMRTSLTDIAKQILGSGNIGGTYNTALSTYGNLMNGILPSSYNENFQKSIAGDVSNTVGNTIAQYGRSGIGGSTYMQDALSDIGQKVIDASAKNYNTGLSTMGNLASGAISGASSALQPAQNLYNLWRVTRYGNKADTVVDQGSSPPLASLGSSLLTKAFGL